MGSIGDSIAETGLVMPSRLILMAPEPDTETEPWGLFEAVMAALEAVGSRGLWNEWSGFDVGCCLANPPC